VSEHEFRALTIKTEVEVYIYFTNITGRDFANQLHVTCLIINQPILLDIFLHMHTIPKFLVPLRRTKTGQRKMVSFY